MRFSVRENYAPYRRLVYIGLSKNELRKATGYEQVQDWMRITPYLTADSIKRYLLHLEINEEGRIKLIAEPRGKNQIAYARFTPKLLRPEPKFCSIEVEMLKETASTPSNLVGVLPSSILKPVGEEKIRLKALPPSKWAKDLVGQTSEFDRITQSEILSKIDTIAQKFVKEAKSVSSHGLNVENVIWDSVSKRLVLEIEKELQISG